NRQRNLAQRGGPRCRLWSARRSFWAGATTAGPPRAAIGRLGARMPAMPNGHGQERHGPDCEQQLVQRLVVRPLDERDRHEADHGHVVAGGIRARAALLLACAGMGHFVVTAMRLPRPTLA